MKLVLQVKPDTANACAAIPAIRSRSGPVMDGQAEEEEKTTSGVKDAGGN